MYQPRPARVDRALGVFRLTADTLAGHALTGRSTSPIEGVSLGKGHPFLHVARAIDSPWRVVDHRERLNEAGMVDLLGMFRRRPVKRGTPGFARSHADITALGDSMGEMLTAPVRDAPPMAREMPLPALDPPRVEKPRPVPAKPKSQPKTQPNTLPKTNGAAAPRPAPRTGYLAVHSVEKSFGTRQVVRGVSIYVRRGEAVGLLGPNGAGKTTVFYMITGLIKADRGAIELDGHDVTKLPMYQRARLGIGYLPQEASIFRGLTVEQNIRAVLEVVEPSRKKREAELNSLLDEFNITRLRKTPSIALSGGERRRVEIARALATRPNYMLLDEPFAGIDPIAVGDIQDLVRHLTNRGIGVLITDHNVRETLGLTDRAYIVYAGEILTEGSPDEIVNNPDVRRLYLGEEFRL
jgi:lipopolysaccharide export system ATP-binding protein